ncbi:glycoside hydrolase family 15 [Knoellia koreensis]|uniref:Glycoside hydrolase family 15 n=1 Tax=Knoellia koreensis TaxID=2730921 RepID=A0A849HJX2_9MICO|nr:glycoside hydrolase family 15 [Knoellia sp. DB2414S]NNM44957.1 glycoside hydrolase family 15 [Knoellia sp. DB2414S]
MRSEPGLIRPVPYRAFAPTGSGDPRLADGDRTWLAVGAVPAVGTRFEPMATAALLDLRSYVQENGSIAAGPGGPWRYTWPRDASFAALAMAGTGHAPEARRIFSFLDRVPFSGAVGFAARYNPDGSPVSDGRPPQADGCGWVLWAVEQAREADAAAVPRAGTTLRNRCVNLVLDLTDGGTRLPRATPDYWETEVQGTTLGISAPLLAGLRATARDCAVTGTSDCARAAQAASAVFAENVALDYGPAYERYGVVGGLDAAIAALMPPFVGPDDPAPAGEVEQAWMRYQRDALMPAGGLAPGVEWDDPDNSWTPETALVAYTAAASGHTQRALDWLDWLDAHRTAYGSLPEKVTRTGEPAGPAPLLWTSSLVLLTLKRLEDSGVL